MKKLALMSGAELAPISLTFGMSSGRGVVSMSTSRLNLQGAVSWLERSNTPSYHPPWFSRRHLAGSASTGASVGGRRTELPKRSWTFDQLHLPTEKHRLRPCFQHLREHRGH